MMSALIREKLHDYAKNKLDIDDRANISAAIEQLYRAGVFNKTEIMFLEYYLRGFLPEEIAIKYFVSTELVINTLNRLMIAIEYTTGDLDELFLRKISAKYNKRQIQQAREFMIKHSKEFTYDAN